MLFQLCHTGDPSRMYAACRHVTAGPNSDPELDKGKKPVCVPVTQNGAF